MVSLPAFRSGDNLIHFSTIPVEKPPAFWEFFWLDYAFWTKVVSVVTQLVVIHFRFM